LAGEIAGEWTDMSGDDEELRAKLVGLARQIVPYNMAHNAEAEACDLLMEIERLDLLEQYVDESAYPRVCLYLTRQVIIFRHFISLNLTY
jgi:26S proteasome regulatory subunit N1